jgi:hypothetical protein
MSAALTNSKRVLNKASYVVAELTPIEQRELAARPSRGVEKLNFLRSLGATREEVMRSESAEGLNNELRRVVEVAMEVQQEVQSPRGHLALASKASRLNAGALIQFAERLADLRGIVDPAAFAFGQQLKTSPVGRLHLERIEMYPVGIEQGELIFTVPLTPKETVTVSHKEWSISGEEYERIVQDYFESYSERGVAEKTDFSMSSENEARHANALSLSSTVSGSYGPVSVTVTAGLQASAEDREAVKKSAQMSREVTEKASARARQEHKVSVKLETRRGTEESSYRTIQNPHEDKAIRVDYYRMMRKWRVDLYRYGLRLTYDIPVPNPGARIWARHRRLRELDARIGKTFEFPLTPSQLNDSNWSAQAATFQAAVEPPPAPSVPVEVSRTIPDGQMGDPLFEFIAPPGYTLEDKATGVVHYWGNTGQPSLQFSDPQPAQLQVIPHGPGDGTIHVQVKPVGGGPRSALGLIRSTDYFVVIILVVQAKRSNELYESWRLKAWNTLREAAIEKHRQELTLLQNERDLLWSQLSGTDTLSLRRMEREELIRLTLTWLIGPSFEATPETVGKAILRMVDREQYDLPDDWPGAATFGNLSPSDWAVTRDFGDIVKFFHHAVEWENLLYFLYPYFWGSDDLAREKLLFEHPDSNHRDFLRAGYARVVIPIRPGFESDFTKLVEQGYLAGTDASPYFSIAEEVAAYARTNYQGIPPANPEKHARPLLYPEQRRTWDTMRHVLDLIEIYRRDHGSYPATLAALSGAPFKDAWNRDLIYKLPGTGNDYDLLSYGKDGAEGGEDLDADISAAASASLIATWSDYTPTSGIDIELTGKPILL